MADADRWADLPAKLARLAEVARRHGVVHVVVLSEPVNLTWLLGCRVHVPQTLGAACFDVVVDDSGSRLRIVTNAIEAPRLGEVELDGLDAIPGVRVEWTVLDWWQPRAAGHPVDSVWSDRSGRSVAADLARLRRTLTPREQGLLRQVSAETAAAATAAAARIEPRFTEYAAAGVFADELLARELDPIVLLVAGADRMPRHRHPLPTGAPLGGRAMLVACGRRHGLVASVTRIVAFDPLTAGERDTYRRMLAVEAAFLDATRAGGTLGEAVTAGTAAYATHGFDAHEWHRHHQGGLTGWEPREFPAAPTSPDVIPAGGVVAWNPSGGGWKVEDTTLVHPDSIEPLVTDGAWPVVDIGGRLRPDVLQR